MTKAQDIRQLIAEESIGSGERRALETVADKLDRSLAKDVPARPEFKAQLRRQLMAQARRQMAPWYKRPAVWGSTLGVAAAAAVLAVGLNMLNAENPITPVPGPGAVTEKQGDTPQSKVDAQLTSAIPDLIQPTIPDELVPTGAGPEGGAAAAQSLGLYHLTVVPDEQALTDVAVRLGMSGAAQRSSSGWRLSQGSRDLQLTSDGQMIYADRGAEKPGAAKIAGADAARTAARQFLQTAVLPVPDAQPVVNTNAVTYEVLFTPRVEGRPVVNSRTRVLVSDTGRVLEVVAFLPSSEAATRPYSAYSADEAIATAKRQGGAFSEADLVWVRTVTESRAIYLQPYWRVFGTNAQGARIARYVPALKR